MSYYGYVKRENADGVNWQDSTLDVNEMNEMLAEF